MALSVHIKKKLKDFELAVDFDMDEGIVGFLGSSGCGKSMTLKCIAGIETPDEGRIVLDDEVLFDKKSGINLSPQKRKVGYLFQNYALFPHMTVKQNIEAGLAASGKSKQEKKEIVERLLEQFHIKELENSYPVRISGGQQQRVAVARAVAAQPPIILADEPTGNLDTKSTKEIMDILKGLHQSGRTVIIITHEMSVIEKICSHVAIIHRGKIVEHGEVEEVFFHPRTEAARRLVMPEALQNLPQENLYRLIFNGRSSFEPVIANMVLECHCPVNIMYADTRDIGGIAFGQMVLQLPECPESRRSILEFAKSRNILLEEMKHV